MKFSVITPSFRDSRWLKLCIASVADQAGVEVEHIVQDAGSDDGTQDWLPHDPRVRAFIEKDSGMYDAVNRGFRRAQGELLAYINCDEQYLPGALRKVADYFAQHPEVDVVLGDCFVVDTSGNYLCERQALVPQVAHTLVSGSLSFLTAGMFMRRRVIEQHQLYFNDKVKVVGDAEWAIRLLRTGLQVALLSEFVSVFTETGHNLALSPAASGEVWQFCATAPLWARALAPLVIGHFRLRRWRAGHYRCQPHDYAIYTAESPATRKNFQVTNPTYRWIRTKEKPKPLSAHGD